MSPYRVPAPPPIEELPKKLRAAAAGLALVGSLASAGIVGVVWRWLEMREALGRLEAQEQQLRRALNGRPDCPGYGGDPITPEERARLEAQLEEAMKKQRERMGEGDLAGTQGLWNGGRRILPKCRCAAGDPLCSEIPGQTCTP